MAANPFSGFNFEELLKQSSSTKKLNYDQLGDHIHERLKVERRLDDSQKVKLKIDYSDFANHVFFDSAVSKFSIVKNKVLNDYPYNGSTLEKQNFELSSSAYESYIFDQWPRYVGHASFNGSNQFISASDNNNCLLLGTSSLYVSAWVNPVITDQNIILQVASGSISAGKRYGYELYLSGATDTHIKFSFYSGSTIVHVSAAYTSYIGGWNNVSAIYDQPSASLSLYINGSKQTGSSSLLFNSIEWKPTFVIVGSGSQFSSTTANVYNHFSGNLDEIRIQHTASEIYHQKYFSRPIESNDFVKLRYTFNEGTTGTASVDQNIVDWSKSNLNGLFAGYNSSCRVSGNIMLTDPGDPILYSFHSDVISFTSSIELSASSHDKNNNNLIYNLIPEGILKEDEKQDQLLKAFSLVMARYFDQMKLLADQFSNLRTANYTQFNETPDLFMGTALKYFGWSATQTFDASNPLSFFFGENVLSSGSLDVTLENVRNQFWKRILNNVSYFFQTKGKRHSIDALFNVLGINKSNIALKEYGFVGDKSSIETVRINKEKDIYLLGIGTGSLSASFVKVPLLVTSSNNEYTVELLTQLPYVSASYSASIKEVTGSLWSFVDPDNVTGSFSLLWKRVSLVSPSGAFILTGSDGNMFSTSFYPVFDGRILSIAAGLSSSQRPFIELRSIDQDIISFSASEFGTTPLTGVFTGSKYDFIVGASSGSYYSHKTHGFFGESRYWTRQLSSSEIDDHALNFESIGINDPLEIPNPLKFRVSLNENIVATAAGRTNGLTDLSSHNFVATGSQFLASANPYKKHLLFMNNISPSIDLKWNENKVRIRNKSELSVDEVGKDTSEIALEFNLIDALNEDISKIFINLDDFHNIVGEPVNKYRDEYVELESYRRTYFERLHREINFTNFFKLFQWFDKKIGTAIKQFLPVRTKFIGGEFVVENHMLERPKYAYAFPIFKTPKEVSDGVVACSSSIISFCGSLQTSLESKHAIKGTAATTFSENDGFGLPFSSYTYGFLTHESGYGYVESGFDTHMLVGYGSFRGSGRDTTLVLDANINSGKKFKSIFSDGDDRVDRSQNVNQFYRTKYSGDQKDEINNPNVGINWKNEWARREQINLEDKNFDQNGDGYHTGSFIHPKIGQNAFVINSIRTCEDQEHYFNGHRKFIKLFWRGLSGSSAENSTSVEKTFTLTGSTAVILSASLYDSNNYLIVRGDARSGFEYEPSWFTSIFGVGSSGSTEVTKVVDPSFSCFVSASNTSFNLSDIKILYLGFTTSPMENAAFVEGPDRDGWHKLSVTLGSIPGLGINPSAVADFTFITRAPILVLSSSVAGKIYNFRDVKFIFDAPITSAGVEFFKNSDNQNREFSYVNSSIMPEIE